ncbi:hypothetical protein PY254_03855 [Rhodanobacter sp. AS-Z3]|uniref:hypothetical protein n=1 Tax=Rhodanobacter sp. AS-Z3 TaxID=3031330 RepID=UPI00247990C1|nr:hypothetical protein [Rhodanobacter sp. AS-Z3]WEN15815.1 hypothetical protein PY254_03855 [Rhodanobacter sp. AS-Z3]
MTALLRCSAPCSVALVAALLLAACGKNAPAPAPKQASVSRISAPAASNVPLVASASTLPPARAATTAAPASVLPTPFSVASLTLGSAVDVGHKITHVSDSFAVTDKTIYASVATVGVTGGATLNATWSYLEGSGQLVSNISQSIATEGPAVTTFMVQNPDLWPVGKYQVEISLDGAPVTRQQFTIDKR